MGGAPGTMTVAKQIRTANSTDQATRRTRGRLQRAPRATAAIEVISWAHSPATSCLGITSELEPNTGPSIPRMPSIAVARNARMSFAPRTLDRLPTHDSVIVCWIGSSLLMIATVSQAPMKSRAVAIAAKVGRSEPVCALATASTTAKLTKGATQR